MDHGSMDLWIDGSMDRNFWREECNRFSFRKATHLACLAKPVGEAMDVNV